MRLIVGDVGGTHSRLAVAECQGDRCDLQQLSVYRSAEYDGLGEILSDFTEDIEGLGQAVIGVAGPVRDNICKTTNLPWVLNGAELARDAGLQGVSLLNDLEAAAWGVDLVDEDARIILHPGDPDPQGNQSVVAAGTGFGQAGRIWCGGYRPFASEGSHADFAPVSDIDFSLQQWLAARFGHVSWERVVSGPGLVNLHDFLRDTGGRPVPDWLSEAMDDSDPAAAIANAALQGRDPVCAEALDQMIRYFGAETGNHALKLMATGGVFITGGIAPKIASRFAVAGFLEAFFDKGRMEPLLRRMPVSLIADDRVGLLGAAGYGQARG